MKRPPPGRAEPSPNPRTQTLTGSGRRLHGWGSWNADAPKMQLVSRVSTRGPPLLSLPARAGCPTTPARRPQRPASPRLTCSGGRSASQGAPEPPQGRPAPRAPGSAAGTRAAPHPAPPERGSRRRPGACGEGTPRPRPAPRPGWGLRAGRRAPPLRRARAAGAGERREGEGPRAARPACTTLPAPRAPPAARSPHLPRPLPRGGRSLCCGNPGRRRAPRAASRRAPPRPGGGARRPTFPGSQRTRKSLNFLKAGSLRAIIPSTAGSRPGVCYVNRIRKYRGRPHSRASAERRQTSRRRPAAICFPGLPQSWGAQSTVQPSSDSGVGE